MQRRHSRLVRPATLLVLATLIASGVSACGSDAPVEQGAAGAPATTTSTAPVDPPDPAPDIDGARLQSFADGLVADTRSDGGIVAWKVGDEDPLVVTSGVADARTGQALHPDDAFDVASITKSFTAAALVLLAEEGALDLDDPISRYVDWPNGDHITVRQLLDQSSGVATFGNSDTEGGLYIDRVAQGGSDSIDDTLDATRSLPPVDEPGGSTTYSNLNYVLAGAVIEDVTGDDLGTVFEQRLFGPLGMDATWYLQPSANDADPLPGLYELEPDQDPLPTTEIPMDAWRSVSAPAVGAVSTVHDLFTWSDAVFRHQVVDGTDVSAMTQITPGGYGLGIVGVTEQGACVFDGCPPGQVFTRWGMNGDIPGSSTRVLYDPATDATLFVYLNRNDLELDAPTIGFLDG